MRNLLPHLIIIAALLSLSAIGDLQVKEISYLNTYWNDITISSERAQSGAGTPTYAQIVDGAYAWSLAVGDGIRFSLQTSHQMQAGTDLDMHAHVMPSGADVDGGNIQLRLECCAMDVGEGCGSTPDLDSGNIALASTALHAYADIGDLNSIDGLSAIVLCSLTRIAAVSDEYDGAIWLLSADAHFEIDSPGSKTESAK